MRTDATGAGASLPLRIFLLDAPGACVVSITELHCDAAGVAVEVGQRLRGVRDELASIVSSLDVSSLVGSEAAHVAVLFAEVERLSMAGKTVSAGRVAETGHHRAVGFDSAQKWLADRTKSTVWEAAKTIETARHVSDSALAPTRSALVGGALTATQANEIATAAAKSPDSQSRLLAFARRETASRLRDECRAVRLAAKGPEDPDTRAKRIRDEMGFGSRDLGGGITEMFAHMPPVGLCQRQADTSRRARPAVQLLPPAQDQRELATGGGDRPPALRPAGASRSPRWSGDSPVAPVRSTRCR